MEGQIFVLLKQVIKIGCHIFHHKHWKFGFRKEADAEELDNVWVSEVTHQLAFFDKLLYDILNSLILDINQSIVECFPSTCNSTVLQLLNAPI